MDGLAKTKEYGLFSILDGNSYQGLEISVWNGPEMELEWDQKT